MCHLYKLDPAANTVRSPVVYAKRIQIIDRARSKNEEIFTLICILVFEPLMLGRKQYKSRLIVKVYSTEYVMDLD